MLELFMASVMFPISVHHHFQSNLPQFAVILHHEIRSKMEQNETTMSTRFVSLVQMFGSKMLYVENTLFVEELRI